MLPLAKMSKNKPKITIKPFRHQVQMDPNYAQNTWKLLKGAIHEIHKQNASGLSFEELYRSVASLLTVSISREQIAHQPQKRLQHGSA